MYRYLKASLGVTLGVAAMAACGTSAQPAYETVTGVVVKTTYKPAGFTSADWGAGVQLQDGSKVSIRALGDESAFNNAVAKGDCVQFQRIAGSGEVSIDIYSLKDLSVVNKKTSCPWAE